MKILEKNQPLFEIIDPDIRSSSSAHFPRNLKIDDILLVLMRQTKTYRLFIFSTYYDSTGSGAIGWFDDELGDTSPRLLNVSDVLRVEKVGNFDEILRIIRERNSLNKRIVRIERRFKDMLG